MKRILSSILIIALLLTLVPVTFAETYDYVLSTDEATYTAKVGDVVSVKVFLTKGDGSEVSLQNIEFGMSVPEGLSITKDAITAGLVSGTTVSDKINVFQDKAITATATDALFTLNFTVEEAGTYTVDFVGDMILLDENYDLIEGTVGGVSATITAIANDPTPPSYEYDFVLKTDATTYTAQVGDVVPVKVFLTKGDGSEVSLQNIEFGMSVPEGLSITKDAVTAGLVSGTTVSDKINVFQDKAITATATDALFTLNFTAVTAGTYTVDFVGDMILLDENYDLIEGTVGGISATVVVEGSVPPSKTLESIAVTPETLTIPVENQADVKAYVESKIEKVVATYSDNSTEEVTGYTVDVAGTTATVTYEGKTDTIALTMEVPAPTLVSIAVTPETLTVPVENQADVKAYVESKIEQVVATYSDDSTEVVTDYTVEVAGTTATVKYEGTTATIALTLEEEPPVTTEYDFVLKTDATTYTAEVGDVIPVKVFLTKGDGSEVSLQNIEFGMSVPEGLSITKDAITAGLVSGTTVSDKINVFQDKAITATATDALFTLNFTAVTAGTYTVDFVGDMILLDENYDLIEGTVGGVPATVVVEGSVPPIEPTLEAITVNVTATPVVVPVGADPVETVKAAITGVTAAYSDGSVVTVTDYTVTVDGDVATVSYMDKKFEIAVEIEVAPTDVEIIPVQTEITVPYGTEDVQAYLDSKLGTVTIKNSDGESRTETATVTYNAETGIATVAYGELSADVTVTVVELTGYTVTTADGADTIVIPYDETDAAAYVASKVAVVGNLSDGSTLDNVVFTVEITENVATIKVGDEAVGEVAVEYAEPPVAAIVDIEIVVADAIVVPYGATDIAAYIESVITVNTIDENGEKAPTSDYTITAEDGVATVVYGEFTKTVDYTLETAVIVPSVSVIEIPYTVAAEDYAAYIAENVTFAVDYTANTTDETVTVTAEQVEIGEGIAVVTVKEGSEPVEIQFTVEAAPEYIPTVIDGVYNLEGKSLVKITGVADGKIAVVDGINATYFGNGTFAVVVDTDKVADIEVVEAEMPAVAEFGKLHDAAVSAYDALMTNDAALEKADIPAFVDIQNYIIADIDGNGELDATDAYAVNQISLLGAAAVNTWVSAQ